MNFKVFFLLGLLVFVCIENATSTPIPEEAAEATEAKAETENKAKEADESLSSAEVQEAMKELGEMLKAVQDFNKALDELLAEAKKGLDAPKAERK